jgi:hypothetical protein
MLLGLDIIWDRSNPKPNGREQCAVGAATHRRRRPCRSRDGRTAQTLETKVLELLKAAQAELIER